MNKEMEKMMGLFDATNRPKMIKSLMSHYGFRYETAEGIWQDAWVVLLTKKSTAEVELTRMELERFMKLTCHNKAMEQLRIKIGENNSCSLDNELTNTPLYEKQLSAWADDLMAEQWLDLGRRELLDEAMAQLSPVKYRLVYGHYYEHKSMRELAVELSLKNEQVAKSTKYRAIEEMKEYVEKRKKGTREVC